MTVLQEKRKKNDPLKIERGAPTAVKTNIIYRMGKLRKHGLLHGKWLDCGCADGGYTPNLVSWGAASAFGIDIELDRISSAKKKINNSTICSYCCASSDALPFEDASFAGVYINEVLEHVPDEIGTLREIFRVLEPGGHIALMSPNRWFPFEGHGMHIGEKEFRFPIPLLPWLPMRFASKFMHARNYWPFELEKLVQNQGFEIISVTFVLPVFEVFPWLPNSVIVLYRNLVPLIEHLPFIRRFGVSTFVIGRKPLRNASF